MMTKWLPDHEENKIPNFAFHTVGVSGVYLFFIQLQYILPLYAQRKHNWQSINRYMVIQEATSINRFIIETLYIVQLKINFY